MSGTDGMQLDGKEDRRFNQLGRIGARPPYTFQCGYTHDPVSNPWPGWVERCPDGKVAVDLNSPTAQGALPGVNFASHKAYPFPWGNSYLRKAITAPKFIDGLRRTIATLETFPFFIYRPPLWLLLNSVGVGKKRFDTHNHSPVAISTQVQHCYLQVLKVLEVSTDILDAVERETIITEYNTDFKTLTEQIDELLGTDERFMALAKKVRDNINAPAGEDEKALRDFARYVVTYTINHMRLLERKLVKLSGKNIDPDNLTNGSYVEYAVPDPQNVRFASFFASDTDTILRELKAVMKLKYELLEIPLPAEPEYKPENSIYGISITALKLLLVSVYLDENQ